MVKDELVKLRHHPGLTILLGFILHFDPNSHFGFLATRVRQFPILFLANKMDLPLAISPEEVRVS